LRPKGVREDFIYLNAHNRYVIIMDTASAQRSRAFDNQVLTITRSKAIFNGNTLQSFEELRELMRKSGIEKLEWGKDESFSSILRISQEDATFRSTVKLYSLHGLQKLFKLEGIKIENGVLAPDYDALLLKPPKWELGL